MTSPPLSHLGEGPVDDSTRRGVRAYQIIPTPSDRSPLTGLCDSSPTGGFSTNSSAPNGADAERTRRNLWFLVGDGQPAIHFGGPVRSNGDSGDATMIVDRTILSQDSITSLSNNTIKNTARTS